jgi:NTE family protein
MNRARLVVAHVGWARLMVLCVLALMSLAGLYQFAPQPALANQNASPARRPKIGLALSGGGARGFAHIGVLEWFEEHRIPVDYIAGTSMGGLVGGLYATGKSPFEIRQLVKNLDWDVLLRGSPAFQQLSYRRKEDSLFIPGAIPLGLKNGARLPSGLSAGMEIGLEFDSLTLPYDNIGEFRKLPIPFSCVATDLVAAEAVVLDSGSLARSLRATMSIPGIFTPVEINGKVLADGGILNNVPTDVVKDMGAEIVIAVDIGTPLGDKDSLNNLFGVLSQASSVATMENVRRNLRLAHLLISPDLEKYSLLDFRAHEEIANLGYKGAANRGLLLEKFALGESEWKEHLAARKARVLTEIPITQAVQIDGVASEATQSITENLTDLEGHQIDPHEIATRLRKVWGTGRFETLDYSWARENGKEVLHIHAEEKKNGPPFLDIGLTVNNSATDDAQVNLLGRLTFLDVGRANAEWRTDFSLGSQMRLATEYFRPLGEHGFFVAPNASYDQSQENLFSGGKKVAEYRGRTALAGVDLGWSLSARSQVRLGYSLGRQSARRVVGSSVFPDVNGTRSVITLGWNYFGQDSAQFPTKGLLVRSSANWFFKSPGATAGFPQAESRAIYAHPLDEKNILLFSGSAGTTFGREAPTIQKFSLGGLFRLGGYGRGELRANHYLLGEVGYLRRIYRLPAFLGGSIFAGGWYDGGSAFDRFDLARYQMSGTGGLLVETRLGPIFIGGSWGEGGRGKFYFSLGRVF